MNIEEAKLYLEHTSKDDFNLEEWQNENRYQATQVILKEIERLKEEYMILQNASDEVEEEKDREIERLNNIINELEKELINCIKEAKLKWGNQLTDKGYLDIQMTVKNYEDVLNKLQELKGSDKE